MTGAINPNIARTFLPPVMQSRRWLDGLSFPVDRPLINVSQAAPVEPPPLPLLPLAILWHGALAARGGNVDAVREVDNQGACIR